ncbi:arsenosugar biosynthesis radical SAM (seleno)protein ArsS [Geomonas propionica]|uniref:Arsenosugar biosynthesis radical SAM protein ArsS n=1 Tax=Geomonas propionica TaxID=2798582 RepID=A0ABS0YST5_9BACT|nr:arsenosugar biosynthesis radical SAM (seleno)protein ArsS [Geomonas propionica]MBJ6801004.1 arsenosugar biosynthesis radical SAM protein ArsS [Geomonas propionica]
MDGAKERLGESFAERLACHGLSLTRERTTALQVNVGLACDLACGHCHLEAGPARGEMMSRAVMAEVIACARRFRFDSIDLTGGAPELVPDLSYLVRGVAPETPRLIVRTNLVSLEGERGEELLGLYRDLNVALVASLPAGNKAQTDAQRGAGVWEKSIRALKRLNALGYGLPDSPLQLDLVSNPSGAFLPPPQLQAQVKFQRDLARKHGVSFHNLYTFANVPLGRFRRFLERSGNLDRYLETLSTGFNPCAVAGLMCRSQLSVDWHGRLYDCDFHLAQGIFLGGGERFIASLTELPLTGTPISAADHCFACTVGSGFT